MDRTLLGSTHVEVKGGYLELVTGSANESSLQVGPEPRVVGRKPGCHLVLDDRRVSATHFEVTATERGVRVRDLGSTNGTFIGDHRVVEVLLRKPTTIRCGDTVLEFHPGKAERIAVSKSDKFGSLVGSTPAMRALFSQLRTLSPTTISVLIEGETGTGKEVVARAIHDASDRAAKPFVVVDCGAIPPTLAESTLFGHERGAFTGATERRKGAMAEADGGTLFLDELGELPLDLQPKLLRVLAEQRIKRVGADSYVPINVRVLAATRRDLLVEINRGTFRDDLYFRIAEERVEVPPLRERTEDIRPLVERIAADLGQADAFKRVTAESFDRLMRHDWPGNVRELRSLVKKAFAYDRGGEIDLGALLRASPKADGGRVRPTKLNGASLLPHAQSVEQHDKAYFAALFEATEGNISEMSRRARLHRTTVREALDRFDIKSVRRKG
jgi:DNA-binding NtrC family response regulator